MKNRLKQLRIDKGLTIKEVSSVLGITVSAYAHYEQGRREPSISIIVEICKFFEVSADYLLGLSDEY